ncbi:hypothetical protein HZA38_03450 [Candidatus Peregrinibacteria bacterium]|nr:hypothetical protein [Candidatus Peregrinibacteria bacterium]
MEANFFLKYRGLNEKNDSEVDLAVLGESIVGFDIVIKEIFKISKINGNIIVKASNTREGSLIVNIIIILLDLAEKIPFEKVVDLINFLRVVDTQLWEKANDFFGAINQAHKSVNDFAKELPADFTAIFSLVAYFVGTLIGKAKNQKKLLDLNDLPESYAKSLHRMITQGKFKKALKPFVENEVSSIEISHRKDFLQSSIMDKNNFENYLSEDEKILPDYENGKLYRFTVKIVGMQCSKGDSMKVRVYTFPKKYRDLVAYPPEGKTTKDFDQFYGQNVVVKAIIKRDSLYQKPSLLVEDMHLQQKSLPIFNGN